MRARFPPVRDGGTDASTGILASSVAGINRRSSARRFCLDMLGYGVASAIALGVDAALLRTLVVDARWHYLPASTVSFVAGAAVAYFLSVRFVFRVSRSKTPVLEFGYFVGLGVVGLVVNAAVISLAISVIGLGLLTAKFSAAGCTFATNFILRRTLIFNTSRHRDD